MNGRDNLLAALKRQNPEHVPFAFSLCPALVETFIKETGCVGGDYMDYYDMPFRYVAILPSEHPANYAKYYVDLPSGAVIDEWGVAEVPGGAYSHFSKMLHPMERFTEVRQIEEFPLPDVLADYRWAGFADAVRKVKEKGLAAVFSAIQIFEPAWYLRGMDNLLVDMMTDEDMAQACFDRLVRVKVEMCRRIAAAGVDIMIYGDDVGTQKAMMMNPALWRKWIKPVTQAVIQAAKDVNPDVLCYYHSDGVINDIIPDLIEIGVDILNPVQPECMDPAEVKMRYGDKLSFWGTIGTQTTMPFGSPRDVERTVAERIETVGRGGGLVIAPTHLLEPEVPWENIMALIHAVKKYGE